MNGKVYLITNLINDKQYVGITSRTMKQRFDEHCKADSYIGRAIRKHGKNNFSITRIDGDSDWGKLCEKEIYYIKKYDSFNNGYNQTLDGDGVILKEDELLVKTERESEYINTINKFLDMFNQSKIATPDEVLLTMMKMFFASEYESERQDVSKAIGKLSGYYKERFYEFFNVICPDYETEKLCSN